MSVHLQRAHALFQSRRFDLAEQELRQALAAQPDYALAHSLLALCLSEREQFAEATREAQTAIHHEPDLAFAHYALAAVMLDRNRPKEAEAAILEAIELDPHDANYFSVLASIRLGESNWKGALTAAEEGLAIDPEHVRCTNLRAMALVKLGRKAEAGTTIDAALARDPEDATTHANQGWTLLDKGEHVKAMEHFREALRLDPEQEWARYGIVEALKARHFIYRNMLRYFLWMAKLSGRAQWTIVIGAFIGYRLLRGVARQNPEWAPWIWPLLGLYLAFVLLSWLAHPLFDLLLRLNRFGRLALSRDQVLSSNWVGSCLLLALIMLALFLLTWNLAFALAGVLTAVLMVPVSAVFRCDPGWPRRWMALFTLGTAALGAACLGVAAVCMLASEQFSEATLNYLAGLIIPLGTAYSVAILLSSFVANALMKAEVRH